MPTQLLALLDRDTRPDRLMDLTGFRASGVRAENYKQALNAVQQAALDERRPRPRAAPGAATRFAAA